VGQSEEPCATVRSACFNRREKSCLDAVAQAAKVVSHFSESESEVARDVLDEHEGRVAFAHDPHDVGPEVTRVFSPAASTCVAEGLARVARSDEIHDSTPRAAVEGSQIRPKRRCTQRSFLHARSQDFAGEGFDLNSADEASSWDRHVDAEVESPGSGRDGQHVRGMKSHMDPR
jgi:hypothetical protein